MRHAGCVFSAANFRDFDQFLSSRKPLAEHRHFAATSSPQMELIGSGKCLPKASEIEH
jgi:hypothetical protein